MRKNNLQLAAIRILEKQANTENKDSVHIISHRDKRIGEHKDFIIHSGGRKLHLSSKRGFPKNGKIYTWFHYPESHPDFNAHFGGEPSDKVPASIKSDEGGNGLHVELREGPEDVVGKYKFKKGHGDAWLVKHLIEPAKPEPQKAAFDQSLLETPAALFMAQKTGLIPPVLSSSFHGGNPYEVDSPTLMSNMINAAAVAGKALALASVAGVGFSIGSALGNKLLKKEAYENNVLTEGQLPEQPANKPEEEEPNPRALLKPSFSASRARPVSVSEQSWGATLNDLLK